MIFTAGKSRKIIHCNLMQSCLGSIQNPDTVVVIHNTRSCSKIVWDAFQSLSEKYEAVTGRKKANGRIFCTGLTNQDAVFGANEKLRCCLMDIIAEIHPELVLVICGCVPGVIGDDTESVCRDVELDTGISVVLLPGHGFMVPGLIDTITSLASSLFHKWTIPAYKGNANPEVCVVAGLSPAYSSSEEYTEIMEILHVLGFAKIIHPPVGASRKDYETMAEASMVVSFVRGAFQKEAAISLGKDMAKFLGVPCIHWSHIHSPWQSKMACMEVAKRRGKRMEMAAFLLQKELKLQKLSELAYTLLHGKPCRIRLGISRQVESLLETVHFLQSIGIIDIRIVLSDMISEKEEGLIRKQMEASCGQLKWKRQKENDESGEIFLSTIPFDLRACDELLIPSCFGYDGWIRFTKELMVRFGGWNEPIG